MRHSISLPLSQTDHLSSPGWMDKINSLTSPSLNTRFGWKVWEILVHRRFSSVQASSGGDQPSASLRQCLVPPHFVWSYFYSLIVSSFAKVILFNFRFGAFFCALWVSFMHFYWFLSQFLMEQKGYFAPYITHTECSSLVSDQSFKWDCRNPERSSAFAHLPFPLKPLRNATDSMLLAKIFCRFPCFLSLWQINMILIWHSIWHCLYILWSFECYGN